MENSFQTSFIPKKPIATITPVSTRHTTNLFTVIAIIILSIISLLSIGLYVYKNYLINQKAGLSLSLIKVRDTFEQNTIDDLELFDKRSTVAKQVLSSHIVLSPLFAMLDTLTLPSIQYTSFNHETIDKVFSVKMSGIASDYKSVALQADAFNTAKGRYLKNIVFSNLNKDKSGSVTFDLEFTVDPSLLSYDKNVALEQAQGTTDTTQAASTSEVNTSNIPSSMTPPQTTTPPVTPTPKVPHGIVLPPSPKSSSTTQQTTAPQTTQQTTAPTSAPVSNFSTTTPPPPPLPANLKKTP